MKIWKNIYTDAETRKIWKKIGMEIIKNRKYMNIKTI